MCGVGFAAAKDLLCLLFFFFITPPPPTTTKIKLVLMRRRERLGFHKNQANRCHHEYLRRYHLLTRVLFMNRFQFSACSCLIAFSLRKKCFPPAPQSLWKRYVRDFWSSSRPFFYSVVHDASSWTKEGVRKKSARRGGY